MLATGDGAWVVRNSLRLRSAVSRCDEDSARLEDELSVERSMLTRHAYRPRARPQSAGLRQGAGVQIDRGLSCLRYEYGGSAEASAPITVKVNGRIRRVWVPGAAVPGR